MRVSTPVFLASVLCSSCGASKAPAASAPAEPTSKPAPSEAKSEEQPAEDSAEKEEAGVLPAECAKKDDGFCTPPGKFVEKLCQGAYPNVALAMFQKGTPWTRGYLTRKTKAWNASGGASDTSELEFDEEVLVLRKRAADLGGMQVSGAGGGYDALRWNGSCVTLAKEELTTSLPPKAKTAKVEWRLLDEPLRESLRASDKVTKAYRDRQKECKGATMGEVSALCVKADTALSNAIVEFVRDGAGKLAKPDKVP